MNLLWVCVDVMSDGGRGDGGRGDGGREVCCIAVPGTHVKPVSVEE